MIWAANWKPPVMLHHITSHHITVESRGRGRGRGMGRERGDEVECQRKGKDDLSSQLEATCYIGERV